MVAFADVVHYILSALLVVFVCFLLWIGSGSGFSVKFIAVIALFSLAAGATLVWDYTHVRSSMVLFGFVVAAGCLILAIWTNFVQNSPSFSSKTPQEAARDRF